MTADTAWILAEPIGEDVDEIDVAEEQAEKDHLHAVLLSADGGGAATI